MRDTVLPAASGGNEEMAASHVCAWLRKVQLSSCPGNFIFVTVIRLPIVYATLLYSSQLGTSLSVQQIALDSAFSHQEKKKFERRASLLKTAAEPNVAETALIDAFSAARGDWLHRGSRPTCFARTAARIFVPSPTSAKCSSLHPSPTPRALLRCHGNEVCDAVCGEGGLCCYLAGTVSALFSRLVEGKIAVWCGGRTFSPLCRTEKKKKRGKRWLRFVAGRLIFRLEALLGNVL